MGNCRPLLRALLVLALIAGQQATLVHAVSHLTVASANQTEPGLPHGKVCGECLTSAVLAAALPSSGAVLPDAAGVVPWRGQADSLHRPLAALGFRSRAPPALL